MTQTDTNPRDWGDLKRLAEDAKRLGANGTMLPVDAVLELIAEVERLRDDQQRAITYLTQLLTSLWPGTQALEKLNPLISQIDNGLTELKNLRDQSFEKDEDDLRAYEEALDVGREEAEAQLTALKSQRDEMAEALDSASAILGRLIEHTCSLECNAYPQDYMEHGVSQTTQEALDLLENLRRARSSLNKTGAD